MIPGPSDPCWQRAICTEKDLSAASLATKILVSRLRQETRSNPATVNEKIAELRKYFEKYTFAAKDIALF
ncbi:hypothetical protein E4191_09645 [Paracoccus liaowanqingii]|uniref:Uncharacterized protein n=1 Tax=Paracoccus liaowanqingii TaxID=2560053 RepID=A0A4P7HNK6_9RHOB|nr:hypothetical protein [Paracoccus liaowanqingii]QBX34947.1 hypothetical protein E4191_09645 [Paracoccus liaowanqingii]